MNKIKLVVIADDFTGALDTAVQFAKRGVKTFVTTDVSLDLRSVDEDIEVLSIDIESRHMDEKKVYDRVKEVVAFIQTLSPQCIYLKTDSTLRGPIGIEIAALFDVTQSEMLMFIPAFPKNGRTTKDGIQYVNNIPLSETIFADDFLNPICKSRVGEIIADGANRKVVEVSLTDIDSEIDFPGSPEGIIYVFDAETDDDLRTIGRVLRCQGKCSILAGCAGFAEVLSDLFALRTHQESLTKKPGNMLVVVGSINQVSLQQISYGEGGGFELHSIPPQLKIKNTKKNSVMRAAFINRICDGLRENGRVIFASSMNKDDIDITARYSRKENISSKQIPALIVENIADITKQILNKVPVDNLVIFGGDTLMAVMKELHCKGIIPYEEIAPGVVLSKILSDTYHFTLVTKAGGLGEKNIIGEIYCYFQQ